MTMPVTMAMTMTMTARKGNYGRLKVYDYSRLCRIMLCDPDWGNLWYHVVGGRSKLVKGTAKTHPTVPDFAFADDAQRGMVRCLGRVKMGKRAREVCFGRLDSHREAWGLNWTFIE
jgi:hypothetical protein